MPRHQFHWVVLAIALVLAVATWLTWLYVGASWTHRQALAVGVEQSRTATASIALPATSSQAEPTDRERSFTERGQLGDSFGGLNALLTAIAGALVFWAGYMQQQLLKKTREVAQDEKVHRETQKFESLFFHLLQLSAQVTDRVEGPKRRGRPIAVVPGQGNSHEQLAGATGHRALSAYAQLVIRKCNPSRVEGTAKMKDLENLVRAFLEHAYDRQPSAFGPYFRILYQTFKHIADSKLPEDEKIRYANIARGQISEGAVLLLALNGLTSEGYQFIPLIEKFGLLEHLHRRYRETCEPCLLLGYRPRAFMGSTDRANSENVFSSEPLLQPTHFKHLEKFRREGDQTAGFQAALNEDEYTDS